LKKKAKVKQAKALLGASQASIAQISILDHATLPARNIKLELCG
jgi:hypothetical protein